jgi:hypothetical protein
MGDTGVHDVVTPSPLVIAEGAQFATFTLTPDAMEGPRYVAVALIVPSVAVSGSPMVYTASPGAVVVVDVPRPARWSPGQERARVGR